MHFFSPANVMRLLEVVEGAATGAATQATAMSLARRLGQKTGAGVYRYEPGDRTPREDVEVLRLIERFRAEQGVTVRAVSDEEIRQRCLYVMVNEAFRILDEGIARRPVDIDVIWNCGYGFPAHKGGLMYWAEREGLATIQARLLDFHDQTGEAHWRPADGLNRRLAEAGAGGERP